MDVVLASGNKGKLREFSALFAPLGMRLIPQQQLNVSEAPEPFHTFVENALGKARHASAQTGLPALADDSGLSVDALGGAPGVLSARYATLFGEEKSDAANNRRLLLELQNHENRRAAYIAVLVFVRSKMIPVRSSRRVPGTVKSPSRLLVTTGSAMIPIFIFPTWGKPLLSLIRRSRTV